MVGSKFYGTIIILIISAALHSLQGALGKTSGRSYKAAPRQLLQVDGAASSPTLSHATPTSHISKSSTHHEGAAKEAAKLGREALGDAATVTQLVSFFRSVCSSLLSDRQPC